MSVPALLHIEVDVVSQAEEDDVLVVFLDEPQIGPALETSVAAIDRRDHMGGWAETLHLGSIRPSR